MICPNCNAEINSNTRFCTNCGKKFENENYGSYTSIVNKNYYDKSERESAYSMFDDVGEKIKRVAEVFFWMGVVVCIIAAIVMFVMASEEHGSEQESLILMGLGYLILGPICCWIGSLFTYGFGELIDKTCDIERKLGLNRNSNYTEATSEKTAKAEELPEL